MCEDHIANCNCSCNYFQTNQTHRPTWQYISVTDRRTDWWLFSWPYNGTYATVTMATVLGYRLHAVLRLNSRKSKLKIRKKPESVSPY